MPYSCIIPTVLGGAYTRQCVRVLVSAAASCSPRLRTALLNAATHDKCENVFKVGETLFQLQEEKDRELEKELPGWYSNWWFLSCLSCVSNCAPFLRSAVWRDKVAAAGSKGVWCGCGSEHQSG